MVTNRNPTALLLPLLLPASLAACGGDGDPRMQGTWRSDKALTLAHLSAADGARLDAEQRRHLEQHLGEVQLHFGGPKVAVSFANQAREPLRWDTYRSTATATDTTGIETGGGGPVAYTFAVNCVHMQTAWGYREYFCRTPASGG